MLMENILKDLASKRTPVRIYTTNGYQMHGSLTGGWRVFGGSHLGGLAVPPLTLGR